MRASVFLVDCGKGVTRLVALLSLLDWLRRSLPGWDVAGAGGAGAHRAGPPAAAAGGAATAGEEPTPATGALRLFIPSARSRILQALRLPFLCDASAPAERRMVRFHALSARPPACVRSSMGQNTQSVVKDFISRSLTEEQRAVEEDRGAIARYVEECTAMKAEARSG